MKKKKKKLTLQSKKIRFYIHRSKNKKQKIARDNSTCIINMK